MGRNITTPPTRECLKQFITNGRSQADAAALLGISLPYLRKCERGYGLVRKRRQARIPVDHRLGMLIALGLNNREIGERCNVSTSTAGVWVREYKANQEEKREPESASVEIEFLPDDNSLVEFMTGDFDISDL